MYTDVNFSSNSRCHKRMENSWPCERSLLIKFRHYFAECRDWSANSKHTQIGLFKYKMEFYLLHFWPPAQKLWAPFCVTICFYP